MPNTETASLPLTKSIPWGVIDRIIPNNEMLETDTPPFTLARLNSLHKFAAQLTARNIMVASPEDTISIADIGSDNLFPLVPLLNALQESQQPAEIHAVDLNEQKLTEGINRPELAAFTDSSSPIKIISMHEDGTDIPVPDETYLEARLIGVLDGTVYGDPQDLLKEMYRILKPNGNAMVSFRSPYLDRLLPAIEQAGNHMLWNTEFDQQTHPSVSPLKKGYPLSRRILTTMLMDTGYSSVTFYGQFPVQYTYEEIGHKDSFISQFGFDQLPHFKAVNYQGESFILPTEEYCKLHETQTIDLNKLKDLKEQDGYEDFQQTLDQLMFSTEVLQEGMTQYTQYMFWFADIKK